MREYIIALFGVAAVAALVQTVSPEGALKKHIAFLCSLCVLAAVAVPITRAISSIGGADDLVELVLGGGEEKRQDYDEIYNSYLLEGSAVSIEDSIERELLDVLSEGEGSVAVYVSLCERDGGVCVESATVVIDPSAIDSAPRVIKDLIYDRLSVECEIIYKQIVEK